MEIDTIDAETRTLAERYQIDPGHIRRICSEWETLDTHGVPIMLRVTGLSQLSMRPSWADFGIAEDDARAERLSTGFAKLFPERSVSRLKTLENRYRYWLRLMTFDVGVYKPFRYMLDKTWSAWEAKKAELDEEWTIAVAEITEPAAYQRAQALLVADYSRIADAAYTALHATAAARGIVLDEPYDSFLQRMVARVTAAFPTRERLIATLKVEVQLGMLQNPAEVLRFVLGATLDHTGNARAAMHALQMEQARRMLTDSNSPLAEVVDACLATLYHDAHSIRAVLTTKEYIPARTVTKIHGLRDYYQRYSLSTHPSVEAALEAISHAIARPARSRTTHTGRRIKYDVAAVMAGLQHLEHICRPAADRMACLHPNEWAG